MTIFCDSVINKKSLVLTSLNEKFYPLFPEIINKGSEEILVFNNYGSVISQPYGCLIRNILLAVYNENIEEIYVIEEKSIQEQTLTQDELLLKMKNSGISEGVLETIKYINVVGDNLFNWLIGSQSAEGIIKNNIKLIQNHPLIPKTVSVNGVIVNPDTGKFDVVS